MYVYLDPANVSEAMDVLRETPGVDDALIREEAAGPIRSQPGIDRGYRGDGRSARRFRGCGRGLASRRPTVPRLSSRARCSDRRVQRRLRRLRVPGEPRRRPLRVRTRPRVNYWTTGYSSIPSAGAAPWIQGRGPEWRWVNHRGVCEQWRYCQRPSQIPRLRSG